MLVTVLDQGERPVKQNTESTQARPTVQYIAEDEEVINNLYLHTHTYMS